MSQPSLSWSKVNEHYGAIYERGEPGARYAEGTVMTPFGIVRVYSEPRATRMWVVRRGRELEAAWARGFRPRYLVTLARRFARGEFG